MSSNMAPKTPTKALASPGKFVKPADLFKMRRRTSTNNLTSSSSQEGKNSPLVPQMRSSPLGFGLTQKVNQFVPCSSKFSSPSFNIESQSPLKCLNNLSDPSPTKNLPTILKNPFNQPVKRKLNLGCSPRKNESKMRSPNKRTKMLEIDEDANLEPPKMKQTTSPRKNNLNNPCPQNDWTLRTKLKVTFDTQCKNWNGTWASTHKRLSGCFVEESPSKLGDNTISIEAIKNASTVYQHPYMAWLSLYPRQVDVSFDKKKDNPFSLTQHSQVTIMMHKAWCESLNDLTSLLIHGHCPYFYVCADIYNILFRKTPTSNPKRPLVQAYISPFSYGMGCELNKLGIDCKFPDSSGSNCTTIPSNSGKESSQASSFGSSSQSRTNMNVNEESSQDFRQTSRNKVTTSIDSGNVSDLEDEDDFGEDENEDASQFLESIGISEHELSRQSKRKGFTEAESNTQSKIISNKPLAVTEGKANILKLINFLQTNRLYTISNVGKFACVPPTLLSPTEFRLSTPQYPEVVLSKNMIEVTPPEEVRQKCFETPKKIYPNISDKSDTINGPTFLELRGTILPHLHTGLHKLLAISDNKDHTCISTTLDSSTPFKSVTFTL